MNYFYFFLLFLITSCNKFDISNYSIFKQRTFYEDIDFNSFEGIRPVKKNTNNCNIEINYKTKNKVTLKIHQKINGINFSYKETFTFIDGYYYYSHELKEDEPGLIVKENVYIKNGIILIFINSKFKNTPEFSKIKRIDTNNNFIEEIIINEELIEPNPNIDFETYFTHPKIASYTETFLEIKNNHIYEKSKEKGYNNMGLDKNYKMYYEGYPNSLRINNFWNLYKHNLGNEISNLPN